MKLRQRVYMQWYERVGDAPWELRHVEFNLWRWPWKWKYLLDPYNKRILERFRRSGKVIDDLMMWYK